MFKLADVDEFELLLPKDIWAAADAVISTAVRTSKEIYFMLKVVYVKKYSNCAGLFQQHIRNGFIQNFFW